MPPLGRNSFQNLLKNIRTPELKNKFFGSSVFKYLGHFTVELFLIFILALAVLVNVSIANSEDARDRSLLFVLSGRAASGSSEFTGGAELTREVLAAGDTTPLPTLGGTALLKPNPSTSDGLLPKRDIEVYTVRGGDTVSTIAAAYGVSTETILWENGLSSASLIKPGQELRILPTSGVKHVVAKGETMSHISAKYDVDLELILEYNQIEIPEHIFPGEEIVIPNGVKKPEPTPARQSYLASLQRQDYETAEVSSSFESTSAGYIWPMPAARRLSQGYWSRHRGIDVPCKYCSVNTAADGIVELSGWQGGYGYTVVVNHGNGVKTRYAHGSRLLVSAGQRVSQGQQVMVSGNTGRSTGPHLHFEIIRNGVYLNPLSVLGR